MASYHFNVKIIGRRDPRSTPEQPRERSVVEAASYRAGERLHDDRRGRAHDFTAKRGVAHSEIMLPDGAAPWLGERERLWNHVEAMEKRKDAQLAREINMALPHELTHEQRVDLVRDFVREQFTSKGMVADVAWHDPVPERGDDPRNFHAHIMLTLRQAEQDGLRKVKTREWNSDELLNSWHVAWCGHQNAFLERFGHRARVDHRSLREQRQEAAERGDAAAAARLDRTPEIHVGPQARAASRKGRVPDSAPRKRATARPAGGSFRSAKAPEKRTRTVDYGRIDRGGRLAWNAERVYRNQRTSFSQVDRLERMAVRLRQREARALRLLTMPSGQSGKKLDPKLLVKRAIAERHARRSRMLLGDVERILGSFAGGGGILR